MRRPFRRALGALCLAVTAAVAHPARACGVSGPDGVSACSLAEHNEARKPRLHLGLNAVYTSTALRFNGNTRAAQTRGALVLGLSQRVSRRVTLQSELGTAFGGKLEMPDGEREFSPGPTGAIGASLRVSDSSPFVLLSTLFSFSAASTHKRGGGERANYEAFDLRGGALIGTTLFGALSPYAVGRLFGGPVYWHYRGAAVTGTDVHHYQLGAGLAALLGARVDAFVEGIPLGERALSAGLALAF